MRAFAFFCLAGGLAVLTGCSTVESRIKERPDVFNSLPERQRALVTSGQVTEGMTRDAVYLAWGKPDHVVQGSERNQPIEEWVYDATRSQIVPGYRPVPVIYGERGRYHSGWDYVFDPVVVTQSYPYKSIRFEDGRAVAWRTSPLR
jgi:hypothetical protein